MHIKLLHVFYLLGASLGVFLAILLFANQRNRYANKFLGFLLIVVAIQFAGSVFYEINFYARHPQLGLFFTTLILLLGPLHYLYARFLIFPQKRARLWHIIYFSLFVCANLVFIPLYFRTNSYVLEFIENHGWIFVLLNIVSILSSLGFMIFVLLLVKKFRKKLENSFSRIDKINLVWLARITSAIIVLNFIMAGILILSKINLFDVSFLISLPQLFLVIMVYWAGFLGLQQPEIFLLEIKEDIKYQTAKLDAHKADYIIEKLLNLFNDKKLFLDDSLSLNDLADPLDIPASYLSQVLNQYMGQSFYDFVNGYRVKEAQHALVDPACGHLSILAIAYQVGFSSKTTFNAAFKKHTGMTPSQYKKGHS